MIYFPLGRAHIIASPEHLYQNAIVLSIQNSTALTTYGWVVTEVPLSTPSTIFIFNNTLSPGLINLSKTPNKVYAS